MNKYYITTLVAFQAATAAQLFHPNLGAHYIDLADGRLLLSAHFPESYYQQDAWEAMDGVEPLPDPLLASTEPISGDHATALSDVLATTASAAPSGAMGKQASLDAATPAPVTQPTVLDVANAAAQIHPLMKLRS
jgi:hypothetical protein